MAEVIHFDNGHRGAVLAGFALCVIASVMVIVAGGFVAWSVGGILVGLAWLLWTD